MRIFVLFLQNWYTSGRISIRLLKMLSGSLKSSLNTCKHID